MKYGYGIDLAQSLNYCGIVIVKIEKEVRITTVKKYRKITYPEVLQILFNDLFPRFPPEYICIDYTNEKAVAETIEHHLHPSFLYSNSSDYGKWKYVYPVVFTQESKLQLKQKARELFERKLFVWPIKIASDPRTWSLVDELKEQMLREAGTPGSDGHLRFSKPQGHDNDLIIALELALFQAKQYIYKPPPYFPSLEKQDGPSKYICKLCKEGKHPKEIHPTYYESTGAIPCPCSTCLVQR